MGRSSTRVAGTASAGGALAERRDAIVRIDGLGSEDEVAERIRAALGRVLA